MPSPSQAPSQPPVTRAQRPGPRKTHGPRKTLWEEGEHPGALVVRAAALAILGITLVDLVIGNRLGVLFDIAFVLVCMGAALWVHPRDFFMIGVLPPLLLGCTVLVLAFIDRAAIAKGSDPLVQAVVSGLAHHAIALVIGYALTLVVLALRQVALRHRGTLRLR